MVDLLSHSHSKTLNARNNCLKVLIEYFPNWSVLFPNFLVTKEMMILYAEALQDLSPGVLEKACEAVIKKAKFFPTIGEIRELAEGYSDMAHIGYNRYEVDPELEKERVARKEAYDRAVAACSVPKDSKPAKQDPVPLRGFLSAEEQKEALRKKGWLR
jgi:hypothetical protein